MEQRLAADSGDWASTTSSTNSGAGVGAEGNPQPVARDKELAISRLESQVEEQRLLRLQDAKQVEAKAAKIKEWVTNKLREVIFNF